MKSFDGESLPLATAGSRRILAITDRLSWGGIETMLLRLIPHLLERGIHVDVCVQGGAGELDTSFEALGCAIHRIPKSLNPYQNGRALKRLLRGFPCNVVHSHKGWSSGAFALAAGRSGTPNLVSFHSPQSNAWSEWDDQPLKAFLRRTWLAWNRRQMSRHVDVFVGHSKANMSGYDSKWRDDPKKNRVIPNGIEFPPSPPGRAEARRLLEIDEDATVIVHIGSFRPEKNHRELLEIARRVFATTSEGLLLMVGEGRLRPEIEAASEHVTPKGRVRFDRPRMDVWPYYSAADVLVFPSLTEGFGNVLVEAQGAALPIVASDIPAHRESVAPEQHRFLFGLGESDRAAELVAEQLEAGRSGTNRWVASSDVFVRSHFSIDRMADQLASLYQEVSSSPG